MKLDRKTIYKIAVALVTATALLVFFYTADVKKVEVRKVPVEVEAVSRGPIQETMELAGWIKAKEVVEVKTKVGGRIESMEVARGDKKFEAKKEPVTLDQHGCQYKPHVLGVMEGQEIIIKNSDDTNHNIHFLPKKNEEYNKTQPKKDMVDKVKLTAEEPFHVKCDVHPWMGATIAVLNHPFFAVTGEDGTFEIKNVPPGKYKVEAWHEDARFGKQTMDVEVTAGKTVEKDFTYEPK